MVGLLSGLWRFHNSRSSARSLSLPLTAVSRRSSASRVYRLGPHTDVTRNSVVGIRVHTTRFNGAHKALIDYLTRRVSATGATLRAVYGLGAVVAVVGMIGSICLMLWSVTQALAPSPIDSKLSTIAEIPPIYTRDVMAFATNGDMMLRPIVSHAPQTSGTTS